MSDQAMACPSATDEDGALSADIQAHLGRAAKSPKPGDKPGYRTRDWSLFFFFRILKQKEMKKTGERLAAAQPQPASAAEGFKFVGSTEPSAFNAVLLDFAQPAMLNAGLAETAGSDDPGDSAAAAFRTWLTALVDGKNDLLIEEIRKLLPPAPGSSLSSKSSASAPDRADSGEGAEGLSDGPAALAGISLGMFARPTAFLEEQRKKLESDPGDVLEGLRAKMVPTDPWEPLQMLTQLAIHEVVRQLAPGFGVKGRSNGSGQTPELLAIVRSEQAEDTRLNETEPVDRAPVSIAFSFAGLEALGLHQDILQSFPEPFRQGMAARAQRLRDIGAGAPENWEGELGLKSVHGYFTTGSVLGAPEQNEDFWRALRADVAAFNDPTTEDSFDRRVVIGALFRLLGLEIVHIELGQNPYNAGTAAATACPERTERKEHFGFRDGISQPFADIKLGDTLPGGGTPSRRGSWIPVAPGEIFLSGRDEGGKGHQFPVNSTLRSGSTFLVFRKLEQDVWGFRAFLAAQRPNDSAAQQRLGAQFVGRWQNGTPLVLSLEGQRAASGEAEARLNDFRYSADDPDGSKCPLGAHIRRANPRDTGGRNDVRHHRLLRRGISYGGSLLSEGAADDGEKRGLLFVAANARIDMQFELIQSDWLNGGEFLGQAGLGRCPLTGTQDKGPDARFLESGAAAPVIGIPNFVTMRGGDYFFAPGIPGLKAIAAGSALEPDQKLPHGGSAMGASASPELFGARRIKGYAGRLLQGPQRVIRIESVIQGPRPSEKIAFVGQHSDVSEVLRNPLSADGKEVRFSVCPYRDAGLRMSRGDLFLVGTDVESKEHSDHERLTTILNLGWAKFSCEIHDPEKAIRSTVQRHLEAALRRVAGGRHVDLVDDLAVPAAYAVIEELYGISGPSWMTELAAALPFSRQHVSDIPPDWIAAFKGERPANPAQTTMQVWMAILVADLLSNLQSQRPLQALARQAATEALTHIDIKLLEWSEKLTDPGYVGRRDTLAAAFVINARAQAATLMPYYPAGSDWIRLYFRDVAIILLEIIGSTLTIVPLTLASVMTFLLNARIDLSFLLLRLKPEGITRLIYEAERLNPNASVRMRKCEVTTHFGDKEIVAGDFVAALIAAANQDPRAFPDPKRFSLKDFDPLSDGPERNGDNYLLFGVDKDSNKYCWGKDKVALPMLQECLLAAGRLQGLRRVAGARGEPQKLVGVTVGLAARFTRIGAQPTKTR